MLIFASICFARFANENSKSTMQTCVLLNIFTLLLKRIQVMKNVNKDLSTDFLFFSWIILKINCLQEKFISKSFISKIPPKLRYLRPINPSLTGGGVQILPPPPSILCSGALNIDLRGTRLWQNSYFKIRVSFWTWGSKIENSKVIQTF